MAALRGKLSSRVSLSLYGSAYHPSAFLWGSTPFLCARAKKWGGTGSRGRGFCPGKRRTRNRARQGGLVIALSACAPIRWAVVCGLSCHSTPFLWCLPKETVSSRQRKAPFLPWRLHHSRERYCFVDGTFLARLGEGAGGYLSACLRRGRTGLVMAALRGKLSSRVSLSLYGSAYRQSAFLWGSTAFLCARAKKWGGTGSRGERLLPNKTAHAHRRTRTDANKGTLRNGESLFRAQSRMFCPV